MLDKNSDISRLLDRLALKNLIEKKSCPSDKRASDVFISSEGLFLLETINTHEKSTDDVLQLTPEEAQQLSNLLDKARG
jgi:DNA-binding MarR family transcriptional regulator